VWLKNFNQSLLKNFSADLDDQKLNTCALLHKNHSRRKLALVHNFSIMVCLKILNQGAIENKKSKSG
jgi:hypothetical protein